MLTNRFNGSRMFLTIAPTQACNFDCIYCYEQFRPNANMDLQTEENIVNYIMDSNPKKLHLTWYGGEPLIKIDSIKRISNILVSKKIDFESMLITNGYLLDEEIVAQLEELKITSVQITLDGKKKVHDSRRFLKGGGHTYDKIINNLTSLLNYEYVIPVFVKIRVNIDKSNEETHLDFRNYLYKRFECYKQNIMIYPGWVTGETNPEIPCLSQPDISKFILEKSGDHYPDNVTSECMARHINSFLIGPNGDLYKCWHNLGISEYKIGNINDKNLIINDKLMSRFIVGTDPYLDNKCSQCSVLPICWGGCPMDVMRINTKIKVMILVMNLNII